MGNLRKVSEVAKKYSGDWYMNGDVAKLENKTMRHGEVARCESDVAKHTKLGRLVKGWRSRH